MEALTTTKTTTEEHHLGPFGLKPRDYLEGEALDRFLARCYLFIDRWVERIERRQTQDEGKATLVD